MTNFRKFLKDVGNTADDAIASRVQNVMESPEVRGGLGTITDDIMGRVSNDLPDMGRQAARGAIDEVEAHLKNRAIQGASIGVPAALTYSALSEKSANTAAFKPPSVPKIDTKASALPDAPGAMGLAAGDQFLGNIVQDMRPQIQATEVSESMATPTLRGIGNPT